MFRKTILSAVALTITAVGNATAATQPQSSIIVQGRRPHEGVIVESRGTGSWTFFGRPVRPQAGIIIDQPAH